MVQEEEERDRSEKEAEHRLKNSPFSYDAPEGLGRSWYRSEREWKKKPHVSSPGFAGSMRFFPLLCTSSYLRISQTSRKIWMSSYPWIGPGINVCIRKKEKTKDRYLDTYLEEAHSPVWISVENNGKIFANPRTKGHGMKIESQDNKQLNAANSRSMNHRREK